MWQLQSRLWCPDWADRVQLAYSVLPESSCVGLDVPFLGGSSHQQWLLLLPGMSAL